MCKHIADHEGSLDVIKITNKSITLDSQEWISYFYNLFRIGNIFCRSCAFY